MRIRWPPEGLQRFENRLHYTSGDFEDRRDLFHTACVRLGLHHPGRLAGGACVPSAPRELAFVRLGFTLSIRQLALANHRAKALDLTELLAESHPQIKAVRLFACNDS